MIQTANCVDDNDSGLSKAWSAMLTNVEDDVIKSPDVNFPWSLEVRLVNVLSSVFTSSTSTPSFNLSDYQI
jgi:hypothetical protein